MNYYDINANRIVTPTHKRDHDGKIIYADIRISDFVWREICYHMDWVTWANFCVAYPQFKKHNHNKEERTLKITKDTNLSDVLIENFPRIKDVVIEGDPDSWRTEKILRKLKTVEKVTVIEADTEIDYITSEDVKELTISLAIPRDHFYPDLHDPARPLLNISEYMETFQYFSGGLNPQSIYSLCRNPIKTLALYNVQIKHIDHFTQFLSGAEGLINIKLMGHESKRTQESFWKGPKIIRERIRILTIHALREMKECYERISECENLESLTIIYNDIEDAKLLLQSLPTRTGLKSVSLKACFTFPEDMSQMDQLELIMEDTKFCFTYKSIFEKRNIQFAHKFCHRSDYDGQTLLDVIMKTKNE